MPDFERQIPPAPCWSPELSWYPPPQDPYAQYGGYPPPPPPPPAHPPYFGYQAPPPPAPAYGRYDYAAYAGYAAAPAPPPAPQPQAYYSPPPPPLPVHAQSPPPPPPQPPLAEGELRPPPDVGVDPNSFRRYFGQQLQALTFNSKPIITALTLFAHEHLVRMSAVVAQCFDEHLRTCPPQYLLPAFYLLDSISKNIGPPYLALFSRFLERAFLSAYHAADPPTRTKLEELLGTWKTGGADGGELFRGVDEPSEGGRVQRGIEVALFGARGRGDGIVGRAAKDAEMYHAGVQQLPHAATSTERSGVLYDVRRLLALRNETASTDPADSNNHNQILALKKLESLILNTQLTTEQVNQIRAQLKTLTPAPPPPPAPAPASAPVVEHTPAPAAAPPPPPPQDAAALVGGIDLGLLSQLSASGALANLFAPAAVKVEGEGDGPALQGLNLEDPSAPMGPPSAGAEKGMGSGVGMGVGSERDEMAAVWEDEVRRLNVGLSNAEVALPRPQAANLQYLLPALPCAQCALRFFPSASGKRKMDAHLDWHFKHKRRIREMAGRTAGRGWFTEEEAWYNSDETTGELAPSAGFSTTGSTSTSAAASGSTAAAATSAALDRAALRALKVPVPAGDSASGGLGDKPCPVCQDKLKSEWSDDEEEWVWWNAVVVDGVLYHATCHAEATHAHAAFPASQSSVARASAQHTGTGARPSRESTPAAAASGSGSRKRAGTAQPEGEGELGEPGLKRVKAEPGVDQ